MYICEIVSSIRNKDKINVYGYMMLKDKNRNHKYYWYCEKRDILKCSGRATTILTRASLRIRFSNSKIRIEKNQNSKFIRITNNFKLIRIIFFELF